MIVEAGSIELDKNEPQIVDAGSIELDAPIEGEGTSLIQGQEPSFTEKAIDRMFAYFKDPKKEKEKATLALVDSESLGIHPSLAYRHKEALDKYYDINPERKAKKEQTLKAIKTFNDNGIEDSWVDSTWKSIKNVPIRMQVAAGGLMQAIEEHIDPEVAMNMMGAIPDEETLKTFELARESRDKKEVYSLGRDVAIAGQKKLQEKAPRVMPGSFQETVGMATESTANNLLYLVPGFAVGRGLPLFMMGTQSMGESYTEQREGGMNPDTALAASFFKGLSEAGTEFIPMGIYLKPNAGFVKRLIEAEFSEIPTEMLNQMVNDVIDKSTIRPDMTIDDAIENLQQTIQVTALSSFALTGFSHTINKTIAKTLPKNQKQTFADASKEVLNSGGTAKEAAKKGIEAVSATPEGKEIVDNQINKMKQEAGSYKPSNTPFPIGVNENNKGEVQSFMMADPLTGNTFEVPAIEKEDGKDNVKYIPDPDALSETMGQLNEEDIDSKLDRLIEGDDTVTEQIFGEDVADFQPEEEIAPEKVQPTANVEGVTVYRGSTPLDPSKVTDRGISTSTNKVVAEKFANVRNSESDNLRRLGIKNELGENEVHEFIIDSKAKIATRADIPDDIYNQYKESNPLITPEKAEPILGKWAKDNGFDAIDYRTLGENSAKESEIKILNPDILRNKAQEGKGASQENILKSINDSLGERGSVDLEPIVNLGRSIINEGHKTYEAFTARAKEVLGAAWEKVKDLVEQAWNALKNERGSVSIKPMTPKKGTANTPAKTTPQAEAVSPTLVKSISHIETGDAFTAKMYHGSPDARFSEEFDPNKKGYYSGDRNALPNNKLWIELYGKTNSGFNKKSVTGNIGVSFTDDYGTAVSYKNKPAFDYQNSIPMVLERYVTLNNPKVFNLKGQEWNLKLGEEIEKAISEGHDGLVFKNIRDDYHPSSSKKATNNVIIFNTEQISRELPNPSRPSEVGGQLYDVSSILNPEEIVKNLKGLTTNIKEAMPHLEALGSQVYESGKIKFNEWSASMKETLGDMWESFKDVLQAIFDKLKEERGSLSNKDIANQDPLFDVIQYIKDKYQGLNYDLLRKDWSAEDLADLMKKRPGVVTKEGSGQLDVIASEFEMGDNDLMMQLLSRKNKKDIISQTSSKAEVEYLKQIYANETVSREEFNKAVAAARKAFKEGNAAELKKLKNSIKWMAKRKETLKNTRDYFGLTDEDMSKISRKNPLLMDEQEFAQYLKDVNLKAIDFKETQFARAQLIRLIEEKRLQKVDNYRQALELPPISKMTTDQLRQFAKLLEPFQDDDIFLTKREFETVDKTILKGIRTWREAKENLVNEINKKRKSKGLDEIGMADLASVAVKWNDSFKWDSSLREQDPFFDLLVTKMTESQLGADLRYHNIETEIYDLAEKAQKSRKRSLSEKAIPQDDLVFQYLESPREEKNAVAQQMTPEELRMAHFIHQYFGNYLDYLISIKALERGRENYITHIRKSFLESVRDDGLNKTLGTDHFWGDLKAQGIRKAVHNVIKEMFARYEEDMMVFNILDDSTGKILPLEKFFQFALHRTGEMQPTKNVVRAFLTYAKMAEKKKAFDAIIPELDIYTQSLTPTKYTPRGLEYDRSLKTFVNKWINNKKGRRISFDSTLRQGGPVDVGIRALRTFTTVLDLGLCIPTGIASFVGEQVTNFDMLGVKGQTIGTQRIATDKGKRILEKYESFVGRSFWENFTAPGKELPERLTEGMFGLFHEATRLANKQFLLASMSEEEFNNEELSIERLADIRLEMGKMRVVPGTNSLIGSTSIGNAAIQYKSWAVPILRSITHDIGYMINSLSKKQFGESLSSEEFKQLYRLVGLMTVTVIVGSMGGDDEDDSFIGKLKSRAYRESTTLLQGLSLKMWLAAPRIVSWLGYMGTAIQDIILLEEYKTKEGLKGVGELKKQITPGVVRQFRNKEQR